MFQSPTGVPGYLANAASTGNCKHSNVSIPNGRPRLFSPALIERSCFKRCQFQSPTGVPGYLAAEEEEYV